MSRIFTLLVALPLILPQGICLCDLVRSCESCAAVVVAPVEPACRHCKCRQHAATDDTPSAAPAKAHTCHHTTTDGDNDPQTCPTQDGATYWKSDLGSATVLPALTALAVPTLDVLPTPASACSIAPVSLARFNLPVYLTTLSLRI